MDKATEYGFRAFITTTDVENHSNICAYCGELVGIGEIVWYEPRRSRMSCWAKGCYRQYADRLPRR